MQTQQETPGSLLDLAILPVGHAPGRLQPGGGRRSLWAYRFTRIASGVSG